MAPALPGFTPRRQRTDNQGMVLWFDNKMPLSPSSRFLGEESLPRERGKEYQFSIFGFKMVTLTAVLGSLST
jgi:hypothetical protein